MVSTFQENVRRGRRFEAEERAGWSHLPKQHIQWEASTTWASKRGRIDIKIDQRDGSAAIVEIKATDWDGLPPKRIRPTAQRHARQVWRYINDYVELQRKDVCAGVVYENEPSQDQVRALVEQVLNERFIQAVRRKGRLNATRKPQRDRKSVV